VVLETDYGDLERNAGEGHEEVEPMKRSSWLWGIPCLIGLMELYGLPKWTMDDAFITFRYARCFAQHQGLVWNAGMAPVEGYTGVLWPVFIGLWMRAGFDPVAVTHIFGVLFLVACAVLYVKALNRLKVSDGAAFISLLLVSLTPILYVNALNGLETMLYVLLVTASFLALDHAINRQTRAAEVQLLLLLMPLCFVRPEGVLPTGLCLSTYAGYSVRKNRCWPWTFTALAGCLIAIPYLAHLGWRYHVYGSLLPNTYFAKKIAGYFSAEAMIGISKMLLKYFGVLFIYIGGVWIFQRRLFNRILENRLASDPTFWRWTVPAFGFFMTITLIQYSRSHLYMGLSHRFFVPFYPFIALIFACALDIPLQVRRQLQTSAPIQGKRLAAYGFLCLLIQLTILAHAYLKERVYYQMHVDWIADNHFRAGKLVKAVLPPNEWIAAVDDAGAFPYYADAPAIDFGALCDSYLARTPGLSLKQKVDYFFSFNPGAAVFSMLDVHAVAQWPIQKDPRFAHYVLVRKFGMEYDYPSQFLYIRRDLIPRLSFVAPPKASRLECADLYALKRFCRSFHS
jgi:hypothetical protein